MNDLILFMMFGSLLLEWFCKDSLNLIWCLCSEKEKFVTQFSVTVADCLPNMESLNTINAELDLYRLSTINELNYMVTCSRKLVNNGEDG